MSSKKPVSRTLSEPEAEPAPQPEAVAEEVVAEPEPEAEQTQPFAYDDGGWTEHWAEMKRRVADMPDGEETA